MNNTFEIFGLNAELIKAISDLGFENPTPIQEKVIPEILTTHDDLIGLAQTGTGKTAAFGLPVLHQTDVFSSNVQTIILSPTRELCIQIGKDLQSFGKYVEDLRICPVYGGTDILKQIKSLKEKPQIVVGTPGRVLDMIKRKVLKLKNIKTVVLDEADEMLNMGFREDLNRILEATPEQRQTLLFSATMPKGVREIANSYMKTPREIQVGKKNSGADNVQHLYYMVHARDRYEALKRIADVNPKIYGIVFCRTRKETKDIAESFMRDGYNADALHGDLSQAQRDYVMQRFRNKTIQMLIATDVAARGLDVDDLTHVINYNLPDELELYVHRSGRTGRAGKSGISISIIHTRDEKKIGQLEKMIRKRFEKMQVPAGRQICEKQLFNLVDKMEHIEVNDAEIGSFLDPIYKKLEWMSREDLIKRFVSVEFNRFLEYYKNAPDLNVTKKDRKDQRAKSDANYTRFFINIGEKDKLNAARLMGLINEQTRNRHVKIGKIDLMSSFSFFEIEDAYADEVFKAFKRPVEFGGQRVLVEKSKPLQKTQRNRGRKRSYRR